MDNTNQPKNSNDLNSFTETAKGVWEAITKTTDGFVTSSKSKLQKVSLQNEVKDAYTRLGNATYDANRLGLKNDEVIGLIMNEIDDLKSQIDQLTQQIDISENINRCPSCNAANLLDAKFCSQCGTQLPEMKDQTTETCGCSDNQCDCEVASEENVAEDSENDVQ